MHHVTDFNFRANSSRIGGGWILRPKIIVASIRDEAGRWRRHFRGGSNEIFHNQYEYSDFYRSFWLYGFQ